MQDHILGPDIFGSVEMWGDCDHGIPFDALRAARDKHLVRGRTSDFASGATDEEDDIAAELILGDVNVWAQEELDILRGWDLSSLLVSDDFYRYPHRQYNAFVTQYRAQEASRAKRRHRKPYPVQVPAWFKEAHPSLKPMCNRICHGLPPPLDFRSVGSFTTHTTLIRQFPDRYDSRNLPVKRYRPCSSSSTGHHSSLSLNADLTDRESDHVMLKPSNNKSSSSSLADRLGSTYQDLRQRAGSLVGFIP
jgi:hypothetical protein